MDGRPDYCIPCSPGVFAVGVIDTQQQAPVSRRRPRRLAAQQDHPPVRSVRPPGGGQRQSVPPGLAPRAPATDPAQPRRRWNELYGTDQRTQIPPQAQPTTPSRQGDTAAPPVVTQAAQRTELRSAPSDNSILPPPVSLKQLAEDASVLLELFSRSSPDNEDNMGSEHHTMISSAATAICAIQARFRQMAAGTNQPFTESFDGAREADCIICYSESADRVFGPCHHLVVCTVCILRGWWWARRADAMYVGVLCQNGNSREEFPTVGALSAV